MKELISGGRGHDPVVRAYGIYHGVISGEHFNKLRFGHAEDVAVTHVYIAGKPVSELYVGYGKRAERMAFFKTGEY
jgi:hypothetical protein